MGQTKACLAVTNCVARRRANCNLCAMTRRTRCVIVCFALSSALACSGESEPQADAERANDGQTDDGGALSTLDDSQDAENQDGIATSQRSNSDDDRDDSVADTPRAGTSNADTPGESRATEDPDRGTGEAESEATPALDDAVAEGSSDAGSVETELPESEAEDGAGTDDEQASMETTSDAIDAGAPQIEPPLEEQDADTPGLWDALEPGDYTSAADLPEANSEMAVAALDGKIYVVGGYPSSRETQDTVQVYDPASDTWALAQSLPEPIHHPVLVGVDGKLYSLGGQPNTSRSLAYDPVADAWSDLAPMPSARGAGAGAVIDDQIYVVGGRSPAQNEFEVYDISDDAWTSLPNLPQDYNQRNHLAAAAIDGKIYVAGGRYDGDGFSSPMTDALDMYDPSLGEWTRLNDMLLPRGGVNGIAAYGCFHVWGGEGSNTGYPNDVFPNHDVYDPTTDQWTAVEDLPIPVHGVTGAAFIDGVIYIPGGGTSSGGSSGSRHFQVFRPQMRCDE
jgi:N-acetylneuraminic acid mutarotase